MTVEELIEDLRSRLVRAKEQIEEKAKEARFDEMHTEHARLNGKAEGLGLAIDYLRSYP